MSSSTLQALLVGLPLFVAARVAFAGSPTWEQISAQAGWSHHSTRQHADAGTVEVYKKTVGELPCFQAVATSAVDPETLYLVATDIKGTLKWSTAGVEESEVLSTSGDAMEYYQYLGVPGWTFSSDRFWFLRGTAWRAGGVVAFRWDRLQDGGAHAARFQEVRTAHPDAVEPPVNVGAWVFSPTATGTQVQYYLCSDVGGSIPQSVQNAATTRTLPDTVGDLVREGRRRAGL